MIYDFEPNSLSAGRESLGLRRMRMNFGEKGTRQSPMLFHETLPILGASVMGMTTWVGQRQSGLPARVLVTRVTTGQRDRISVKGRLYKQLARVLSAAGQASSDKAIPNHYFVKA
jgi:hypothetical protein